MPRGPASAARNDEHVQIDVVRIQPKILDQAV
jgi:hypothetical protein